MILTERGTTIDLGFRETLKLADSRGATLRVTRGTIWITQQNDIQDIVLHAGDTWAVERDGLTIVEAQQATSLCVMERNFETRASEARARMWARVRDAATQFFTSPTRNALPYV